MEMGLPWRGAFSSEGNYSLNFFGLWWKLDFRQAVAEKLRGVWVR